MLKQALLALFLAGFLIVSPAGADDASSPVDLLMENISRDLKKLSRQIGNASLRTSSIKLVDAMIVANSDAAALVPESVGGRSGAEREKYLARYRAGMEEMGKCLALLKTALLDQNDGQAEILIELVYSLREKYHQELL